MLPQTRQMWKQALSHTRIKLVYARITLTRFTTLYFFLSLFNCIVLVIIQGVAYADNSKAVHIIGGLLAQVNVTRGLPIFSNGVLQICDSLPGQPGTNCITVPMSKENKGNSVATRNTREGPLISIDSKGPHSGLVVFSDDDESLFEDGVDKRSEDEEDEESDDDEGGEESDSSDEESDEESDDDDDDEENGGQNLSTSPGNDQGNPSDRSPSIQGPIEASTFAIRDLPCAQTLTWLQEVLEDEKREDVVTVFFNFWLFSVAIVTILNESLPHLGASLAGHILATGWSAFRVQSILKLRKNYEKIVVAGTCGVDFMKEEWNLRKSHTIPILVISATTLLAIAYLSFKLFKVYALQSFSRVGASPQIILVFSAFLQLTAFFSLASTAVWIDHICYGAAHNMARHQKLYLAAFVLTLMVLLPWLVLGWVSVRKEGRKRFLLFSALSLFLLAVSAMMFASVLYRFIFSTWSFFATITVTSFVLIVATSMLGFWCRLHFGRGLSHFLQVSSALEDVDFTPVNFVHDPEKNKATGFAENPSSYDEKYSEDRLFVQQPEQIYPYSSKNLRGLSIYSEAGAIPIKLSSTPSLFQERERALSTRRQKKFGGYVLNTGSDGYQQPQVPLPSASSSSRSRASARFSHPSSSPRISIASSPPTPVRSVAPTPVGLPANPRLHSSDVRGGSF